MAPQGTHAGGRKLGRCQQILMGSHGSKFCKSKSAGIASGDVLPLPSVSFDAPNKWNSLPLSRSVIRRLQSKNHIEKWLDLGISALNSLGGFHTSRSGGLISNNKLNNHFHHIKHFRKDYDSVGPPPSGWCPQEAFRELQGSCGDYAGISGSLAVYREGGVSLPDVGSKGAVLASLSSGQASLYLDEHDSLLRSHDSRDAELAKLEFDRPYIDPVLKQSAVKYSGFVRELHQKGVIKYDYTHTADVGVFFVKKKDDSLRLIFDTRVANCHFINPDATDLTGPAGISDIPCDPPGWSFGQGDIKNAFYMFKTPVWLHQYFCLPPVRARDVGVKAINGKAVAGHEIIYPQVQVLPMGWSWATYFCQSSVVSTLIKGGHVSSSDLVRGNYPSPPLRDDRSHLIVYIDNFAHISSNNDIAVEHTKKSAELLNAQGLPVHDISWSNTEEAFLGTLLKTEGSVFNSSKRLWKIRGCIEHMLASPRLTGQQLEKLIGHITFAFLIRRELLSILSSAYAFISVNYYSRKWLWASVKRELSIVLALLPLANSKCFYPFDPVVYCSDACEYGHGTCRSEWDVETVKNVCSIRERWRFLDPDAIHARDHALQNELNSHVFDSCKERPFDEVPPHLCESQHWQVLTARKFNRQENILILEGRALMWALKRKLRDVDSIGKRHLFLVDNLALALSVEKGRSSAGVNNILRSWCANILASSVRAYVRWIPSENNPADRPSRLFEPKKHVVPKVAFSKICPTECSNTTCPGQSFSHRPKAESVVSSSSFLSALSDFDSDHAEENCSDSGNHHSQAQPSHSDRGKADNQRRGQPKTKSFRQPSNHCSFKWYQCASRIFDRACYTSALLSLFPGILKGDASIEDEVSDRHHFCRGDAPCLGFVSGRIPRLPIFLRAAKKRWGLPGGSVKYHMPRVCTPLAHRALKGWDRLEPAQPREPLPWICVAAIAVELLLMQQPLAALATLLMFTMYLRPMELLESTIDQWTPPTSHLGGVYQFWVFTVRPVTSGKPAKNRLFDQSIALDRPELAWISEILVLLCQQKPQAQMFAPVSSQFALLFKEACVRVGISCLGPVPYSLRHGGVSHDIQERFRSLEQAQLRGRWLTWNMMRRYEKHGSLGKQLERLTPTVMEKCRSRAANIEQFFRKS